jgi:aryl-alcohol dehydrogenase-like predicted oxidoreductase
MKALPQNPGRRSFLKRGAAALMGAYLGFYVPRFLRMGPSAGPTPNMQYRVLGRTGFKVSEVGFGGYPVSDPNVVDYAIDMGINYFDTSDCYRGGESEKTIGKVMKRRRDEVVLTTKFDAFSGTKREEMLQWIDASLARLETDRIDCILVHQIGKNSGGESIERLENPDLFEAFAAAKRQGKVRYLGCSGHDPDLMEVMNYALRVPDISVILCRYNFLAYPTETELFRKAKEQGVGTIAMKTLAGARGMDLAAFRDGGTTFRQAALKWVLSNPDISNLIISISSREQVDEYATASGRPLAPEEKGTLSRFLPSANSLPSR